MRKRLLMVGGLLFTALIGALAFLSSSIQADNTVVVTAPVLADSFAELTTNPTAWFFYNDENDTIDISLGSFVAGPATPPAGNGSVQIAVTGSQRRNIATYQFSGTKLADITTLKFSTYNPSAGNGGSANRSAYLQFNVDFSGTDTWQRRMTYLPSANGAVTQNSWQEWDAINSGNALWSWSGFAGNGNKWPDGNTNAYRTWSDILAAFPNVRIRVTDSFLGLRVGEPYADGYTENIDAIKFGTPSGTTTFDFEEFVAPSVPSITTPANNASVTTSALVKVDWTDSVAGTYSPLEYQYEAFSDAGYTASIYQSSWLSASEIPTPGTPPADYYLRVRARDSIGTETAWSNDASNPYKVTVTADQVLVGPPTTKAECRNQGWKTFNNPSFKNQGKCIEYVEKHSHKVEGNIKYSAYGLNRWAEFEMNTADGDGHFFYFDANKNWYKVKVSAIKVDGKTAWFAGKVVKASNPSWVNLWLFAKAVDNKPTPDQVWGSFTDEATAKTGVQNMSNPADGPFAIKHGHIKVK